MFDFLKKNKEIDLGMAMGDVPESVSEGIVQRDRFFHSCWMLLKRNRPDLWEDMTRVELVLSNYNPDEVKKDLDNEKDKPPEGTVM